MKISVLIIFFVFIHNFLFSNRFLNFNKSSGLGTNIVHDVVEVKDGCYFFTAKGIKFWNGNVFKNIEIDGNVYEAELNVAYKDKRKEIIWFASISGSLGFIENGEAKFLKDRKGEKVVSKSWIINIDEDSGGDIIFVLYCYGFIKVNTSGLYREIYFKESSRMYPKIISFYDGKFFGISRDFVFHGVGDRIRYKYKDKFISKCKFIKCFDSSNVFVATFDSVFICDTRFSKKIFFSSAIQNISDVFMKNGDYYLVNSRKVVKFVRDEYVYLPSDSFEISDVSRISFFSEGIILFSTISNGIYVLKTYNISEKFPFGFGKGVFSIDKVDDKIFIGGLHGFMSVIRKDLSLFNLKIGSLLYSNGLGRTFCFSKFGQKIIISNEERGIILDENLRSGRVLSYGLRFFYNDKDKNYFSSSRDFHIGDKNDFEKGVIGTFSNSKILLHPRSVDLSKSLRSQFIRPTGFLKTLHGFYLTSNRGIHSLFLDSLFVVNSKVNANFPGGISAICSINSGTVCVVRDGNNFLVFDELKRMAVCRFKISDVLVHRIVAHSENNFWACTDKGLYLISFQPDFKKYSISHFTSKDGLLSDEVYDIELAQGKWWIGTSTGLSILSEDFYKPRKENPPNPSFFSFALNGRDTSLLESRALTGSSRIYFSFGCLSLRHYGNLKFRYRLSPSAPWIYTNQFDHELNSLSYGDYRIEVQAKSPYSVWSASLFYPAFQILPPVWERGWFLFLMSAVFFSAVFAIVYNFQRVRLARFQLEAEMTDASLRSLRSQMKPHFLSNILNSMHYFILSEKPEEAGNFVSRFSRLVRHMLDTSDRNYIELEPELFQLREYLNFECSRAGRQVDFAIVYQRDADFSKVLIPTMLLQPLVENALIHGIFPLPDFSGRIQLRLGMADAPDFRSFPEEGIRIARNGRLLIQLCDNGRGRKAATRKYVSKDSPSFGLRSIKERLRWIERRYHAGAEIQVSDLYHPDGRPAGTSVVLNLPLIEKC